MDNIQETRARYARIAERDKTIAEPKCSGGGSMQAFFLAAHSLATNGIHGVVVDSSALRK